MSLFSWLSSGKKRKPQPLASVMPSSGMSRMESTKPFGAAQQHGGAHAANRKQERMVRREQLYGVVRESMVRASVLSSSYKFKVLSLDPHGRQFLVMVDLAQGAGSDTKRLAEIEAMIAQTAKARYDILVTAVYWRANEYVAVGDPLQHPSHRMPLVSQPAALHAEPNPHRRPMPRPAAEPAPATEDPTIPLTRRPSGAAAVDPLHADEVAAFKKALDAGLRGQKAAEAGARGEKALAAASNSATATAGSRAADQNYTLLTGFEDTEMASDGSSGELSGTQYGTLR